MNITRSQKTLKLFPSRDQKEQKDGYFRRTDKVPVKKDTGQNGK